MIDELFLVQDNRETRYYESRRTLAKAACEGYLNAKTHSKPPVVVRFQRVPSKVANSDIGPDILEYLRELPRYTQVSSHERQSLVDAMEKKINELLN